MPVYSHSRLNVYRNCPLQYKFIYMDRIERREETIEAFLGNRFHEAMEKLYKDIKYKAPSLPELLDHYENLWDKKFTDDIIITKKELTADDYRKAGRKFIEDYYKRYQPFDRSKVLGIEKAVKFDLNGDGKYLLQGYIDRLDQPADGIYEIHDYKTSGTLPEQKYLDRDDQLGLYHMAVEKMWNDVREVRLIWHYVAFDREIVSARTKEDLEKLKKDTIELIEKIQHTSEFLPVESYFCDWCSYQDLCPKKKHLFKAELSRVNEHLDDDGVKLVNSLTRLSEQKGELNKQVRTIDEEMAKIREAAVKYAEKEGVDIVYGTDHKLKISDKKEIAIPAKDTPGREELEKLLKEINKWEEVSDININTLGKLITEGAWPEELTEKTAKYLIITDKKTLSLSKIKEKPDVKI